MAKAAFSMRKTLFTSKLDLNLRKKLVKCYIWSMALYGAETWTLLAADQKYLESFEMWCWRRIPHRICFARRIAHTSKVRMSYTLLLPSVCN
jgi:squalene cyclase